MTVMNYPILPPVEDLTLAQLVAQMIVVRTSGHLFDHELEYPAWEADGETLRHYIQDLGVGGVIFLGGSAAELGIKIQQLQAWSRIPLLLAADIEEGVGQRFSGATWFPPPMALGAIAQTQPDQAQDYAFRMGAAIAQEAIAIGLNWVLAPVVDINNNPLNPVINVRAFGESPQVVSQLTTAFIQGAQQHPVLTSAKHFPGHGDTATDSHLALPIIPHDRERLEQVELVPFQAAIAAGVDSIMTAHLQVSALDAEHPSTLSPATLTGLLRQAWGFEGLIVTDAMIMGAITQRYGTYEAAVLAVEAGADVVLMPGDPAGVIQALCEAVRMGRIPLHRIQASVERLWRAKQKVASPLGTPPEACHAWEQVPPPPVQLELLAQPATHRLVEEMVQASLVGAGQWCPTQGGRNLIVVDEVLGCRFLKRTSPAIAVPTQQGYHLQLIDNRSELPPLVATQQTPTLLQVFIRGNPFHSSAGINRAAHAWFQALLATNSLEALVVYGSPYVWEEFRRALPATVPCRFSYGQMPAAQSIVLQDLLHSREVRSKANQVAVFTD